MKNDQNKSSSHASGSSRDSQQDRLKLALRENLKRRKSQARGRNEVASPSSETTDASLDDADGKSRTGGK